MHILRSSGLCCALLIALVAPARSEDWPKGYIAAPGSESPDGRYGILIESKKSAMEEMDAIEQQVAKANAAATATPSPNDNASPAPESAASDDADDEDEDPNEGADEDEGYVNYAADLKSHQLIGKIKGSDYFQGQNHAGFSAQWSEDSKLCAAVYDGRYGFASIVILEPAGDHINQVEVGEKVQKTSDATVKTAGGYGVDLGAYFRFEPGGKIRVRAFGQDNPKQLEPKTHYVLFRGTYDYPAK
jgi:ribosomal protein L12E/L44/L45/RPP1/RPP2